MDEDEGLNPIKRPRVGTTMEEVLRALKDKTTEVDFLNKKFDFITKENEELRKTVYQLIARVKELTDDATSSEDDMVVDEAGSTKSTKSLKKRSNPNAMAGRDELKKSQANAVAGSSRGEIPNHQMDAATGASKKELPKSQAGTTRQQLPKAQTGKTNVKDVSNQSKNVEPKEGGKSKSVPVVTTYNINVKLITTKLENVLGHNDFNIKILGRNVTNIGVCTLEDFARLRALLGEEGVHYFTHTPKAQRPFSLVVRGLSDTFDKEEVLRYMQGLRINTRIMGLHKLGRDRWLFQMGRESDLRGFRDVKYILHCRVFMEKHSRRDVVQCYNCQRFGHVAVNCNMPFRCVKCGGSHEPGKCLIPPKGENNLETLATDPVTGEAVGRIGLPVRCVNCGNEGHAASSRECPKRLELIRKLSAKRESKSISAAHLVKSAPRVPSGTVRGVSYATAARAAVDNSTRLHTGSSASSSAGVTLASAGKEFDAIDGDCRRLFGGGLLSCLGKLRGFAREYRSLGNDESRSRALLGMLISLQHDG